MNVTALIPAYNEADRIEATVTAVSVLAIVDNVVVIDDGSTDETADIAEAAGARTLRLGANRGKGAALDAGADEVGDSQVVLLLDADLGGTASQAELLAAPVIAGDADMAVATFPRPAAKAGFGLVKGAARWGIRRMGAGFEADAPLSGQRALSREAFDVVRPFAFGYGVEVAMTVRALRAGLRVVEIPTTMQHAATGRDLAGFRHRGVQFVHVIGALTRLRAEQRRARGRR